MIYQESRGNVYAMLAGIYRARVQATEKSPYVNNEWEERLIAHFLERAAQLETKGHASRLNER